MSEHQAPRESTHEIIVEEEVTFAGALATLWRYRWFVIVPTAVIALGVYAISKATPPTFQAVAKAEVRFPPGQPSSAASLASFRTFLTSSIVAERVLRVLGADKGQVALTAQQFLASHLIVEGVRNTNLFIVRGQHGDPAKAADIANTTITETIAWTREQGAAAYQPPSTEWIVAAEGRLRAAMDELSQFRGRQPARSQTDAQARQKAETELRLLDVDIEALRARIGLLEQQAERLNSDSAQPPAVRTLNEQLTNARNDLAIAERRRDMVADFYPQAANLSRLARAELELALRTELYNIAKAVYVEAIAGQVRPRPGSPALMQVDKALPPTVPVSPRPARNAGLAALVILVCTSVIVLLADAVRARLVARNRGGFDKPDRARDTTATPDSALRLPRP
jgi:capsular polysaccharide biosynthesis protein